MRSMLGYAMLLAQIPLVAADTGTWIPTRHRGIAEIRPAIAQNGVVKVRRDRLVRIDLCEFRVRACGKATRPVDNSRQSRSRHAGSSDDEPASTVCFKEVAIPNPHAGIWIRIKREIRNTATRPDDATYRALVTRDFLIEAHASPSLLPADFTDEVSVYRIAAD